MTRLSKRATTVLALLALGSAAGFSHAAGPQRGHGHAHQHTATCGCDVQSIAGYLTINGCTTKIVSGRGMNAQIVRAFRKEGYRAWIQDGCVRVEYGHCKPSVRWRTDDYAVQIRWGWGDLRVSLREVYRHQHRPVRVVRPVRRTYRYGYGTCG